MSTATPIIEPAGESRIDFQTEPGRYRHWALSVDGRVATLQMVVDEQAGLRPGYELKLNSYDLAVDIELYDAVQRLRFEHPEVAAVVLTSGREKIFCAGANIRMLGQSSHAHKVNFCKFTNETRNGIEDASTHSGQTWIAAINGACAGGGYELALACEHLLLIDDRASSVALPELPLLAVLPGTGGLTRLTDKRKVRRDRADFFCTVEEGIKGQRALDWGLVDEIAAPSGFEDAVRARAEAAIRSSDRPAEAGGVTLTPLAREFLQDAIRYQHIDVRIDRAQRCAEITLRGPDRPVPEDPAGIAAEGAGFWPLAIARELDDLILHLRLNEDELGTWLLRTEGDATLVAQADAVLARHPDHWLVREVTLYLKRVLKRLDVSARSILAAVEPASCFTGTLAELLLAADQSFMLAGAREGDELPPAAMALTDMNFGPYPMVNGLTRLESRFLADPGHVEVLRGRRGEALEAEAAEAAGLVTHIPDDIDWEDELRIAVEARASFSPDALSGMEANLRFAGPETMESKIFGRLSAWQNWIFQRPNAVGDKGALVLYGSGQRADYAKQRV